MNKNKLRIFVFFSGGASGLKYLMDKDPNFNKTYQIIGCLCDDKTASGIEKYQNVIVIDYRDWCQERGYSRKNPRTRELYFEFVAQQLPEIDLIILSGFMKIIPQTFLDLYPRRIINIHPADLNIEDAEGNRKYKGDNAVELAMTAGEKTTASTIHFAEKNPDEGEIIWVSEGLPVTVERDAKAQQEMMKTSCDGPALAYSLALIARGSVSIETKEQANVE